MKTPEQKKEHDGLEIAERAASALEAGEDAGELDDPATRPGALPFWPI